MRDAPSPKLTLTRSLPRVGPLPPERMRAEQAWFVERAPADRLGRHLVGDEGASRVAKTVEIGALAQGDPVRAHANRLNCSGSTSRVRRSDRSISRVGR